MADIDWYSIFLRMKIFHFEISYNDVGRYFNASSRMLEVFILVVALLFFFLPTLVSPWLVCASLYVQCRAGYGTLYYNSIWRTVFFRTLGCRRKKKNIRQFFVEQ